MGNMKLLCNQFYKPLKIAARSGRGAAVIGKEDVERIFAGIDHVLQFNETLLEELQNTVFTWSNTKSQIGPIFVKFAPYFKVPATKHLLSD